MGVIWKEAKNLLLSDLFCIETVIFESQEWKKWSSLTGLNTDAIQTQQTKVIDLIFEPTKLTALREEDIFIETFGCTTTAPFLEDIIYITLTGTTGTTTLATLHAAQLMKDTGRFYRLFQMSKKNLHL